MLNRWCRSGLPGLLVTLALSIAFAPGCGSSDDDDDSSETPSGPVIAAEPAALNFGAVDISSSKTLSVTVSNTGGQDLTVSDLKLTGSTLPYSISDNTVPSTVAPGGTLKVNVTFKPTTLEEQDVTLDIISDATNTPTLSVTVTGNGTSPDDDSDGYTIADGDCDDTDPAVNPGAKEVCNEIDDNCNNKVDDSATDATTWYLDADGDEYGTTDTRKKTTACTQPKGYVDNNLDCDDADATISPAADELCDSKDNNCDGKIDEGTDHNNDGVPDCEDHDKDGFTGDQNDCNDNNPSIYPGAQEVSGNGVDDNCDGRTDENAGPTIEAQDPLQDTIVPAGPTTITVHVVDDLDTPDLLTVDFAILKDGIPTDIACTNPDTGVDQNGTATCDTTLEYGDQTLLITATDSTGTSTDYELHVVVDNLPTIVAKAPADGTSITYGTPTTFTVAIEDSDEALTATNVTWASTLQGPLTPTVVPAGAGQVSVKLTLTQPGEQTVIATVMDSLGGSATATFLVTVTTPDCGSANVAALWHLDEGSGSTFVDQVEGITGTGTSVTWTSGPNSTFLTSLNFAGAGSLGKVDDPNDALSFKTYTIDFWFKANSSGGGPNQTVSKQALIYKDGDSANGDKPNYFISVNTNGFVEATFAKSTAGAVTSTATKTTLKTGTWYYIAVTWDGRYLSVFVNGQLDQDAPADSGAPNTEPKITKGPVYFGSNVNARSPMSLNGMIDDVQMMDCFLLPSQIQTYYSTRAPHVYP